MVAGHLIELLSCRALCCKSCIPHRKTSITDALHHYCVASCMCQSSIKHLRDTRKACHGRRRPNQIEEHKTPHPLSFAVLRFPAPQDIVLLSYMFPIRTACCLITYRAKQTLYPQQKKNPKPVKLEVRVVQGWGRRGREQMRATNPICARICYRWKP